MAETATATTTESAPVDAPIDADVIGDKSKGESSSQVDGDTTGKVESPKPDESKETIKVNGKEIQVTRAQLREMAEKSAGADERFRDAAEVHKANSEIKEQLQTLVKSNPLAREILTNPDFDAEQWAMELVAKKIEMNALTPEERELMELREFKKTRAQREEEEQMSAREQAEQAQHAQAVESHKQEAQAAILDAIKGSNGGILPTPDAVRYFANEILIARKKGLPVDNPEYLRKFVTASIPVVKDKIGKYYSHGLSALTDDELVKSIDPAIMKRINAAQVKAIRGEQQPQQGGKPQPKPSKRKLTWDEIYGDT